MKRPSWFLFLMEVPRGFYEMAGALNFLLTSKSHTDGNKRPVFVIPGFLNNSYVTFFIRKFLERSGYKTYDWGLGWNTGELRDLQLLSEKIKKIYAEERQPVTLIGFSLGGVYARELAKMHPEMVSGLITLASPFRGLDTPNNVSGIYDLISRNGRKEKKEKALFFKTVKTPAPVPTVAVYSKTDGVVPWEACMEVSDELHKNIELPSSHFGLVLHKDVLKMLATRIPEMYARSSSN